MNWLFSKYTWLAVAIVIVGSAIVGALNYVEGLTEKLVKARAEITQLEQSIENEKAIRQGAELSLDMLRKDLNDQVRKSQELERANKAANEIWQNAEKMIDELQAQKEDGSEITDAEKTTRFNRINDQLNRMLESATREDTATSGR